MVSKLLSAAVKTKIELLDLVAFGGAIAAGVCLYKINPWACGCYASLLVTAVGVFAGGNGKR
jgi:hypothetical protein